jgi:hypothetical protein
VFDPSTSETLGIKPCLPKLLLLGVVDVGVVVGPLVATDELFCVLLKMSGNIYLYMILYILI